MTKIDVVDVVVVGAGPAGLAAALTAAQVGAKVTLIEREQRVGGRMGLQPQKLYGLRFIFQNLGGIQFCDNLAKEAQEAGVELMLGTRVLSFSGERIVRFARSEREYQLQPGAIILASGSRAQPITFPGCDLPGVITADDAQETLNLKGVLPGNRVLMLGSDNDGLDISKNLMLAGARVVALVEWRSVVIGQEANASVLRKAGTAIYTSSKVVMAKGDKRITSAVIAKLDAKGAATPGTEIELEIDALCIAAPRTSLSDLALKAGCPLVDLDILGGPTPVHDPDMATPIPGIYVCGDAAGVENGAISLQTGYLAGLAAVKALGYSHPQGNSLKKTYRRRLGYLHRGHWGRLRHEAQAHLAVEYSKAGSTRAS